MADAAQDPPPAKRAKILGKSFRLFDFIVRDSSSSFQHDDDEEDDSSSSSSSATAPLPSASTYDSFLIQMFGINERGETASITVTDFRPFFFIKGGDGWNSPATASAVLEVLRKRCKQHAASILEAEVVHRKKLYGFTGGRTFPFIKVTFATLAAMNQAKRLWWKGKPLEVNRVALELYESNIPPVLRFFHIYNISPSGWIFLRTSPTMVVHNKTTTCMYEYQAQLCHIAAQPDKEALVPYKICSFDIEASSSHGDFPLPVKTYKRLCTNLLDMVQRRSPASLDATVFKRVILTAFGMDSLENVDRVFPKVMPTKPVVKNMIDSILAIRDVYQLADDKVVKELIEIDRMFSATDAYAAADGGDDDDADVAAAEIIIPAARNLRPTINLTFLDVLNHAKLGRDVKLQVANDVMTRIFPRLEGDQVTYIGSTFLRYGEPEPYLNHCLVVGPCDPVDNVTVEQASTERDLLLQWRQVLEREDPDIVIGYNIFGFDWEFMFRRAQENDCVVDFLRLSRNKRECNVELDNTKIVLATGEYDLRYPKLAGRIQIDLYTYFRRDFNLASYKLDDVASSNICDDIFQVEVEDGVTLLHSRNLTGLHVGDFIHLELAGFTSDYFQDGKKFRVQELRPQCIVVAGELTELSGGVAAGTKKLKWGMAKDDMTPQDIFRMSRGSVSERATVAKYCVQDCNLVHHLMRKLDILTGFVEMSRICSVPISFLVFRGQGIKLTSFVAKKCREKNTLMPDLQKSTSDEGYEGAIVLPPKCAMYMDNPVACVDYSSLYPSSMISQNYSHDSKVWTKEYDLSGTLIKVTGDWHYDNLPGIQYIDTEFDTYQYVKKTPTSRQEKTVVGRKICRWAQLPDNQKSIMPAILEELLSARKKTRKAAEKETDPFMANILDKRQLGYKVTANSLYGQCGAKTSTFYEQDVAASTTATGRQMIMYAKHMVEEVYGHRVVETASRGAVLCKAEYVYGDSVASWTPVYVRVGGETLDILSISELATKYGGNRWYQERDKEMCELRDVESWSASGWTPLHRVIRHRLALHKKMYRVRTRRGLVDVTDDHSLLRAGDAAELSPKDIKVGETRLLHHALPLRAVISKSPLDWDFDDDDKVAEEEDDLDFVSMSAHWTFENAVQHHRYFPETTICMGQNTQVDAAQVVWLAARNGWTDCRVRGKEGECYQLTISAYYDKNKEDEEEEEEDVVLSMDQLVDFEPGDYVYDLTTANHHFSAGIGTLVVHNTDSVFFTFNLENPETGDKIRGPPALEITIEIAQDVAKLCTQFLKPPMELSYEKTLMPFILLSKKRYVGMLYETNPTKGKLKYMGLSLKRRDSCDYLKDVYGGILNILIKEQVEGNPVEKAIAFLDAAVQALIAGQVPMEKLTITKALRSDYKNPQQIGHWVLAERMGQRDAGTKPKPGDRMRFVFVQGPTNGKKALMGDRIETPEYVVEKGLTVDYAHYITNQLMKPLQQLFGLALVPIWESRGKAATLASYRRDLAALERESKGDLEVFMKKKEKYCSEKVKTLIFEKHLIKISNDHQRLQSILTFFNPA